VDKRDATYKSNLGRDPLAPSKDEFFNPGPGYYNPQKAAKQICFDKAKVKTNFGTNAARESLFARNVMINPFKDNTNKINPSPQKYQ